MCRILVDGRDPFHIIIRDGFESFDLTLALTLTFDILYLNLNFQFGFPIWIPSRIDCIAIGIVLLLMDIIFSSLS